MGENFFQRWSRRKAEQAANPGTLPSHPVNEDAQTDITSAERQESTPLNAGTKNALPALQDVYNLTQDSDYSLFVAKGVDKTVRRAALKKMFSDPHFNMMDGLDIYIDDYTQYTPIPPALLSSLQHAQSLFSAALKTEDADSLPRPESSTLAELEQSTSSEFDLTRQDAATEAVQENLSEAPPGGENHTRLDSSTAETNDLPHYNISGNQHRDYSS